MALSMIFCVSNFVILLSFGHACQLESLISDKRVSLEESTQSSDVVFKGLTTAAWSNPQDLEANIHFQLINTYKGAEALMSRGANIYRQVNVSWPEDSLLQATSVDCGKVQDVPTEYIVFCTTEGNLLRTKAVARWSESTEQRVWKALGWDSWSDWSACSVSCSGGIQQRTRVCRLSDCPGYNVEQRHCNLFGCYESVDPLSLDERRFFHPSRGRWEKVPDRQTAWRLRPNSYIWVPSTQLFATQHTFPKEFTLFVTLRLTNDSRMGTIFSLRSRRRQDAYLSLELAGRDGVNLVHADVNGTDIVRIPASLDDNQWHQIAISIRDDSTVQSYVDCEWLRTDILKKDSFDTPEDSDVIIGYLFLGDLEQITIVPDPTLVSLQCSPTRTAIIDASLESAQNQYHVNIVPKKGPPTQTIKHSSKKKRSIPP